MEDEGFSVVFLDRDFTDPFEESWWTFFKKNRVEDFKHTTKSHPLYLQTFSLNLVLDSSKLLRYLL